MFEIETGLRAAGPCAGERLKSVPVPIEARLVLLGEGAEALAEAP